jgi:signal transduction histidine kinase
MTELSWSQLLAGGAYLLPALVWTVIATDLWSNYFSRRPRSGLWRLLPYLATTVAGFYTFGALLWTLPTKIHAGRSAGLIALYVFCDALILVSVAMFRHASLLFPLREQPPSRAWLVANYSLPFFVLSFANFIPDIDLSTRLVLLRVAYFVYITVTLALSVRQIARFARRGIWRPGGLGEARYADLVMLGIGLAGISLFFVLELAGDPLGPPPVWGPCLGGAVGLVLAAPFTVRRLAEVLRRCVLALVSIALLAVIHAGIVRLAAAVGEPQLGPIFRLVAIFLPALIVLAVQTPLRRVVERLVLRRNLRRRAELHAFLLGLSPELGIAQSGRDAVAAVVRVVGLRGAAVALESDKQWVAAGAIDLENLRRLWQAGMPFPDRSSWAENLRELPEEQQEAFIESDVTGTVPIVGPRRRWGHLLFAAYGWSTGFADDDVQILESFAGELALVLDTAELLERAVSVERSLAHSEKLAAIGELSARVAHEIRNPVTAARSLAQQLLREPGSPFREEHELILIELERVERQVAALLRFARRDEFEFAAVDLGALVRQTASEMTAKAAASGITLAVEAPPEVVVRGDREKLRQVLVNLCENSIDALREHDGERRIAFRVGRDNGHAALSVADNGPGVAPQVLPRIFEAFFSGKERGTGLGLAIVKRIVDAHGGEVHASTDGGGMTLQIDLPLGGDERAAAPS